MLLWLLHYLAAAAAESALAGFTKITLRAALAAMVSFLLAVALGPRTIRWLQARFREPILCDSDAIRRLHEHKSATPTMGGLFIVAGLVSATCLLGDLSNPLLQAAVLLVVGLGLVGAVDDLVKLRGGRNGLSVRGKLAAQMAVATLVALLVWEHHRHLPDGLVLVLPFWGQVGNLGLGFIPLAVLVLVGSCNAVNLTDGLDGLAGGCLIFTTAAVAAVTYAAGHAEMAHYLAIPRIPGAGELAVPAAALVGGVLGFLWFNCHPAQVFMGDTGALPLGGLLGLLALAARQEWLLAVAGGVFVAEAGSVILQVGSCKLRNKRIFRCAPLHHHFQLLGWPEGKIVVRFWIAGALCALAGLAALKLNIDDVPHGATVPIFAAQRPDDPMSDCFCRENGTVPFAYFDGATVPIFAAQRPDDPMSDHFCRENGTVPFAYLDGGTVPIFAAQRPVDPMSDCFCRENGTVQR